MTSQADARAAPLVNNGAGALDVEDARARRATSAPSTRLFVAVFLCCMSPLLFGFSLCFTSPAQGTMTFAGASQVPGSLALMSKSQFSTYASLFNIGAVVGAFAGSAVADSIGRKKALAVSTIPHIIHWLATAAFEQPMMLTAARIISGVAVGMGSSITPCYIGEVSPAHLRGALGAANQLSVTTGILLVNVFGSYVTVIEHEGQVLCQWRRLAMFGVVLALVLMLILLMPESPKWLAQRGDVAKAKAALARLRAGDCTAEQDALVAGAERNTASAATSAEGGSICEIKKTLVVGLGVMFFMQFSGINAIMMYTNTICKEAGMQDENAATIGVLGLQVVLTGVSCVIMDRFDRRTLLGVMSVFMSLAHFGLAAYYYADGALPSVAALASLGLFIFAFSLAMGPISWMIFAEMFPTKVLGTASAIGTGTNWGLSFFVTKYFAGLQDAIGSQGVFFLFGFICFLDFIFVRAILPETRGRTAEEVVAAIEGGARAPKLGAK